MLTALVVAAGGPDEPAPAKPFLGMPWVARLVRSAERAGGDAVVLVRTEQLWEVRRALRDTAAEVVALGEMPRKVPRTRLAVVSTRVVAQPALFRELSRLPIEPDRLHTRGTDVALVETADAAEALRRVVGSASAEDACAALSARFPAWPTKLEVPGGFVVRSGADLGAAEKWLLRSLVKDTEGFLARHVSRKISLSVSRALAGTRVTPNVMTGVSVALGLFGALCFLSPSRAFQIAGALLFLLHSILDGCDGELARLKFQESRLGGILDFWGDNLVHAAVFTCLAVSWSRAADASWPLWLGLSAAGASLAAAAFVYQRTMTAPREGPLFRSVSRSGGELSRLADELARRDFIYGVPLLAAFGKASWLLAAASVGSPVFLAMLLFIAARERSRVGAPARSLASA